MKAPEHIPARFFDLLANKTFSMLTRDEQEEWKQYSTPAEFDELHEAATIVSAPIHNIEAGTAIHQNLVAAFDKKFMKAPAKTIMLYPVQLWKVAAVLLLFAGTVVWTLVHNRTNKEISYITIKDTVYIPSVSDKITTSRVYDTVYINPEEQENVNHAAHAGNSMETVIHEAVGTFTCIPSSLPEIRLLSLREETPVRAQPREKELRDDTVLRHSRGVGL